VVDAAGAIYVIGGWNSTTLFADVWASTDGGARAGLGQQGWSPVLPGNHTGATRGGT
jgi:hypothetical protein